MTPTGHDAKLLAYNRIYNELYLGQNYGTKLNGLIPSTPVIPNMFVYCHCNHEATCTKLWKYEFNSKMDD